MRALSLTFAALFATAAAPAFADNLTPPVLFQDADMMNIGVYYYPEAWPTNQWARDIANIKKMGLEFVHMGEFAWAFMEPQQGQYNFDWLDENVRLCAQNGLKVILCTPSPAPPVWLSEKYPDVLMVDAAGRRMQHGSREQACWNVEAYRQQVAKITDELGRRYGDNPAVWGWQLDNELSHYGKDCCYCDSCQQSFRDWLKQKYATIDKLNEAWGDAFWSQMYQRFDQIRIPNQDELPANINPHALLDFQRWFADTAADYLRFQTGVLRKHVGHRQFITSNFMNMHGPVYPPLNGKDFEIMTWTLYPAHGNVEPGPLGFRLGNGDSISFMHDFLRNINGNEGLMELQPGQVNWGNVNPLPYPNAIYMWIMRAYAAGAKTVCTYRYRQPLFGAELYHYGLVGPDGVTPTIGGEQYARAMSDIVRLRSLRKPGAAAPAAAAPAAYAARRAALLYNVESRWDIDNHKQTTRWDTMGHLLKYYSGLKQLGCPVDVLTGDKDFSQYPVVIAPAWQLVDQQLVQRWAEYVDHGGNLVLTCRTAQKDRRGHLWEAPWAGPINQLIGARVAAYDCLPAPFTAHVKADGADYEWASWGEQLEPASADVTPLAQYSDQFYAGKIAAITRAAGRGSVTYVGVDTLDGALEARLLRGVFDRAKIPVAHYDPEFLVDWRDGFRVAANFSSTDQAAPIPDGVQPIVGARTLPPGGVAIWAE